MATSASAAARLLEPDPRHRMIDTRPRNPRGESMGRFPCPACATTRRRHGAGVRAAGGRALVSSRDPPSPTPHRCIAPGGLERHRRDGVSRSPDTTATPKSHGGEAMKKLLLAMFLVPATL